MSIQYLATSEAETIHRLSASKFEQLWKSFQQSNPNLANSIFKERCRYDVELFTLVFFSRFCTHPFNAYHLDLFERWRSPRRRVREVDAAPRGFAKSTFKILVKPIHDICFGLEDYICVVSNTSDQATAKLKDIRSELLENQLLISMFGPFFSTKAVGTKNFVATCGEHQVMFSAFSAGTEIRGVRFGAKRPTKVLCDDYEHSEEVESEEIRKKYEDHFKEVISKIGDESTSIEMIGTVLHKESLISTYLKNPIYNGKKYQAIISWATNQDLWNDWEDILKNLDNPNRVMDAREFFDKNQEAMLLGTKVLWPERFSYYHLMLERFEIGARSFEKEMQNDPVSSEISLFEEFHYYKESKEGLLIERSGALVPWSSLSEYMGVIDPATGQTKPRPGKKGDTTCILTGAQDGLGRLFVHGDITRRMKPHQFIEAVFEAHKIYKYTKFGVETNLYRELLLPLMREERTKREEASGKSLKIPFYDIENTENKLKRIHTLEPRVNNGYILFNRSLSHEFFHQMKNFPDPNVHDDGPDALEMLWGMFHGRYKSGEISNLAGMRR